jgi:general stress protein 26
MEPTSDTQKPNQEDAKKHAIYAVDLAKKLADGKRPGVLATVDENGRPHLRWMATVSLQEYPLLYTITSPQSRKIEQINKNPNVSWMFSNDEMTVVVNISGKARIETDFAKINRVWKLLEDKSKAYFLSIATDGPGFAVIETEVEEIECVAAKYDFRVLAQGGDIHAAQESH